jgi:hypothetical protein
LAAAVTALVDVVANKLTPSLEEDNVDGSAVKFDTGFGGRPWTSRSTPTLASSSVMTLNLGKAEAGMLGATLALALALTLVLGSARYARVDAEAAEAVRISKNFMMLRL